MLSEQSFKYLKFPNSILIEFDKDDRYFVSSTDFRFNKLKEVNNLTAQEVKKILKYDSFEKFDLEVKDGYFYYRDTKLPDELAASLKEEKMGENTFVALRNLWLSLIKRGASDSELKTFVENCNFYTPFTNDGSILLSKKSLRSDKCVVLVGSQEKNFEELFTEFYPNTRLTKRLRKAFINYFLTSGNKELNMSVFNIGHLDLSRQRLIALLRESKIPFSNLKTTRRSVQTLASEWTENRKVKAVDEWDKWSKLFEKLERLLKLDEDYKIKDDYKIEDYNRYFDRDLSILETQNLPLKVPEKFLKMHGINSPFGIISVAQGTHDLVRASADFNNCLSNQNYQDDCTKGELVVLAVYSNNEPYIVGSFKPGGTPVQANGYSNSITREGEGETDFIEEISKFKDFVQAVIRRKNESN